MPVGWSVEEFRQNSDKTALQVNRVSRIIKTPVMNFTSAYSNKFHFIFTKSTLYTSESDERVIHKRFVQIKYSQSAY